ncbi:MAG: hypothetical protein ACTHJ3_07755 [Pararhizobium sp.]
MSKIEGVTSVSQIAMHADTLVIDAILRSYARAGKLDPHELEREAVIVGTLPTASKGGDVAKVVELFQRRALTIATSIRKIDASRKWRAGRLRILHTSALYAALTVMISLYVL